MTRALFALLIVAALLAGAPREAAAAEGGLRIAFGDKVRDFDAATLLARPDIRDITVPNDVAYRRDMKFRAVPLLALLDGLPLEGADTLETRATDGFVSQLPLSLILKAKSGGSVPWVAIEDPAAPWPKLPGKSDTAGPFYLVWLNPDRSHIRQEQWPYALAALTEVEAPARRWPQIAVDPDLGPNATARHGQEVYVVQCLPCHRMRGGGEGDMGPDLALPRGPTEYMTRAGLIAQIRDPKSLRTWPDQKMPGFNEAALSATDVDALIAYLRHMAHRRDAEAARSAR
jgi:mono/diheme cytochrome c family protein